MSIGGGPQQSEPAPIKPRISTPLEAGKPTKIVPLSEKSLSTADSQATNAGVAEGPVAAASADPLKQIGKPDLDGYLLKKSDRYGTWKMRYVVLKNSHMYLMKSPHVRILTTWP